MDLPLTSVWKSTSLAKISSRPDAFRHTIALRYPSQLYYAKESMTACIYEI